MNTKKKPAILLRLILASFLIAAICLGCSEAQSPTSPNAVQQQKKVGTDAAVFSSRPITNDEQQVVAQVAEAWRNKIALPANAIPPQLAGTPVFRAMQAVIEARQSSAPTTLPASSLQQPPNVNEHSSLPPSAPPRVKVNGRDLDLFEVLISPDTPAEAVVPFLFAPDQATRWAAAGALELRGQNVGVNELIKIVETDSDIKLVEKAAWALSAIGDYRGREVLRTLSESSNPTRAKIGKVSLDTFGTGPTKSVDKLP